MLYYVETPTDKLVYSDVELDDRTQNKIDKYNTDLQQFQDFVENHPKLLQRKDPDPVRLARYEKLKADVSGDVVLTHVVLRDNGGGSFKKIKLDLATCLVAWDGVSQYARTVFGTFPAGGIPFAGWPQTDVKPDEPNFVIPPMQEEVVA